MIEIIEKEKTKIFTEDEIIHLQALLGKFLKYHPTHLIEEYKVISLLDQKSSEIEKEIKKLKTQKENIKDFLQYIN